ncbi:Sister chromatid cohesion protein 2 [Puccinia graminis f. sp. tritici]|uniref:Sister chromatid cohesion protein n=1 Tax=Puccinia graminis f. sp. tritici TaxID=56615 RepID=A0A5B0PBA9_PUCGR|nr:Sister chromatid cohesion protein 2 [Puccinia graminis f. sp. tritici]KAA1100425.1 Sister chromatid cohesion protein 2 [Puccinia graminis f. sp. tritici]
MERTARSYDEENRPPSDSAPVDRTDPNPQLSSPILPDHSSATVQADIARAAREMLSRYPIGTTLLRPDFSQLISNLSVADPHPTGEFDPLAPFHESLSLVDRGLVQSANMNASSSSSSMVSPPLSIDQLNWVHRQLGPVNRLIEQHTSQPLLFKDLPYSPLPSRGLDPHPAISSSSGPAVTHASTLKIPTPSPLSDTRPASDSPLQETTDPVEIKSFYRRFVTETLQQQLNQANHHHHQQQQLRQQQPDHQAQQAQHHSSQAQSHATPLPPSRPSFSTEGLIQSEQPFEDSQRAESPDPLAMNLATRSAHRSRSTNQSNEPNSLPSPHLPKKRRTNKDAKRIAPPSGKTPTSLSATGTHCRSQASSTPVSNQDPSQKFLSLVEDVLEADDMSVPAQYFCPLESQFLLSPPILSNIKTFLEQTNGEAIEKVPIADLTRLIKILERGVKIVEDLSIIPAELKQKQTPRRSSNSDSFADRPPSSKQPGSKSRMAKPSSKRRLKTVVEDSVDGQTKPQNSKPESEHEEAHINMIEERLKDLVIALHSTDAALAILAYDKHLPKQFYSEELIRSLVKGTKDQLNTVIFPFVEANNQKGTLDAYLQKLRQIMSQSKVISSYIAQSFSFFSTSIVPKIDVLVKQIDLSESIIAIVSYITIAPFFVDCGPIFILPSSNTKSRKTSQDNGSMKAMRLECLKLLRNVSSKYPDQRSWIIEEILNSILNLPEQSARGSKAVYHLANGKSIQTFSALLFHIVQSCLSGTRSRVGTILSSSTLGFLDSSTTETTDLTTSPSAAPKKSDSASAFGSVKEFIDPEISAATKLSKKIMSFLLQKSGKSTKSSHEAQYRILFDKLVEDLICVIFLPDWPVAEFMLGLFCKTMIGLLESSKVSADSNAVKSMCLDYLGPITAKLMEPIEQRLEPSPIQATPSLPFKAIIKTLDQKAMSHLFQLQKTVLTSLEVKNTSSDLVNTAADFAHAQWMCEMINASTSLQSLQDQFQTDSEMGQEISEEEKQQSSKRLAFLDHLNSCIRQLGSIQPARITSTVSRDCSDEFSPALAIGAVNEAISKIQGLKGLADVFLDRIMATSASPSVTFRSKSIKALALVVAKDETVFFQESVRKAIENRMHDSSPAVRDATVELIGKYVVDRPDLAVAFLPQISARIADKGVSVRKRVIKLLKAIYLILDQDEWIDLKVDISHRLISRIFDEETSMKVLAMNALDELWFNQSTGDTFNFSLTSSILMKVTAAYKELPSPVESVMKFITKQYAKQSDASRQKFDQRCKLIVEHLIDQLMDVAPARDQAFSEVGCIQTICILTFASPKLLEPNKALMLLPYLKGATTASENMMVQYLLQIFRVCVTLIPKSSSTFGEQLQRALLVLVNKPNLNGGGAVLQELIACFCAVVIYQTRDYDQLLNVFKACEHRLRNEMKQLDNGSVISNTKSLPVLMYLVSTVVAYGKLDQLPAGQERVREALKSISQDSAIHVHTYNLLLHIYDSKSAQKIRNITLTCLGFLFRAFPSLMTRRESINLMDNVFNNPNDSDLQHRLLKLIVESISNQIEQGQGDVESVDTKEVDVNQLIGNVDAFPDSGVISAIVQRYLPQITTLAQSTNPHIQKTAVEIISFTIKQGLTHPLECVPVLVALESSKDMTIASQVFALHTLLHIQRGNLVHCRFLETMNKVFDCHRRASGTSAFANGYLGNPTRSVLASWYTLLSEKRVWRLAFLKALIKSFSIDPQADNVDRRTIAFQQYLAEALLTLELKTEEEAMVLIESLNCSVGQSAYQTLQLLDGDPLKALLSLNAWREEGEHDGTDSCSVSSGFNSSIVLGIAFVLRDLLKEAYGISDQKLSKFEAGVEKGTGSKSSREKLISRSIGVKELAERFVVELERKVPGLDERLDKPERLQKQIQAFGDLVRYDSEVLEKDDHVEMPGDEEHSFSAEDDDIDEDGEGM